MFNLSIFFPNNIFVTIHCRCADHNEFLFGYTPYPYC